MANTQRGQATLTLDKERTLLFDLNALADVEDKLGMSMTEIGEKMSIKVMRTLLTAGLSHEDPELTERQVGAMITMDNIKTVQDALSIAMGSGKN
ncbi:hypothetical protein [Bacillus paramobilis]|uniref:hypothetical protein n=1 Tax=Bacillus paramobilis TaxID=2817477 RepID=UPI001BB36AB1|nr:hypothetical protein [Bacillus paramobilis]HEF5065822.1 hypothetical protein [Bacillus cereus]HEF5237806.1 hypothetical protein [Bacillus cereus]